MSLASSARLCARPAVHGLLRKAWQTARCVRASGECGTVRYGGIAYNQAACSLCARCLRVSERALGLAGLWSRCPAQQPRGAPGRRSASPHPALLANACRLNPCPAAASPFRAGGLSSLWTLPHAPPQRAVIPCARAHTHPRTRRARAYARAHKQQVEDYVEVRAEIGESDWAAVASQGAAVVCRWDFA
jgi:hypothetical protein